VCEMKDSSCCVGAEQTRRLATGRAVVRLGFDSGGVGWEACCQV